ncbi:MAG TPA: alpha-2-macroglobulin family protein [Terriglobales bacterium]|nr:alpha-2-macroglobulin family protein [Terriglobales bacterium]
MRPIAALTLLLSLLLPLPATPQEDQNRESFFSVNSNRTWAPGQNPTIDVWAQNQKMLEFRIYKVKDPVKFFTELRDTHSFGGRAPKVPHTQTLIERFHNWKYRIFAAIRDFFRFQFTANNREIIRKWRAGGKAPPPPVAGHPGADIFAQIPLINRDQLVATFRQNFGESKYRWQSQQVSLPISEKGTYLIEVTDGKLRAYTIVMISNLAIITKTAPGHILVFAADRGSGAPVAGAAVRFWSNGAQVAQQQTDASGLAETVIQQDRPEQVLVMARTPDDFAVNAPYSWYLGSDPARTVTSYVYTDRPVYRPGDTMHFKAILRARPGVLYTMPPNTEYRVEILDPEGKSVFAKAMTLSPMGTFHGEFAVPAGAALGNYFIQLHAADAYLQGGSFYVEEYKKPEYEVRVTPEKPRVLQGEAIHATIDARYYFGEPVANAKVTWVVHQARYWSWGFGGDEEEQQYSSDEEGEGEEGGYYAGEQTEEVTARLDQNGRLDITIPTKVNPHKYDINYRIEARVMDEANREIAGHGYVLATYGRFRINVEPNSYVYQAGDTAKLKVQARDYDNNPVQTAFHLAACPYVWNRKTCPQFYSTDGQTDANGNAEISLPLGNRSGEIRVTVTAITPELRELETQTMLWLPDYQASWMGPRTEQLQIIPDKKSYQPGDVAHLLIMTGKGAAHVLVTTEGATILSRQVVHTNGGTAAVDVPIKAEYAPNVFVVAAFLHDNKLHQGSKSLNVPPDQFRLNVKLQPSKPQFQPGEAATYTLTAADSSGKLVSGAEFSLGVVDEAIYAIRPDATQDIMKFFYGRTFNRVGTDSSLAYYFYGQAGKKQMQLAAVATTRALAQLKPERLVQPRIRKAFPDTAFWVADARTDASGRLQVRFNFPDSLTTWRTTARGITQDSKVGSATDKVVVRKNIMLQLALPRFFRQGDEVTVSAIVHNYLKDAKTARVSLDVKGLDILEGSTRDVDVPSRGDAKVDWRVRAANVRQADLLGKALTTEESDAMEITLPVIPYGVKLSLARSGSIAENSADTPVDVVFPEKAEPTSRALTITASPSLAGAVFGALEYLVTYPYGCTEQTMSSFLPNIIVAQATRELGINTNINPQDLAKKIAAGLDRLYQFQHEDGGWGWWQTDDSGVFMTAYVLAGLSQAQQAGYAIKPGVIDRARTWMKSEFDKDPKIIADLRAYMLYALVESGLNDRGALDSVWNQRSNLTPHGLAFLGLAMSKLGDARTGELATNLENQAKSDDQQAWWESDRDYLMDFYEDTSPETTAYALKFLTTVKPDSPLVPKAAVWLVTHRNDGYYWYSTKQTAMVIYGLTGFLKRSGELKPDFTVEVVANGKTVLTRKFTEADALLPAPASLSLPPEDVGATNHVRIRKTGTGRLYWSVNGDYYSAEKKLTNVGSFSLTLAREYFKLTPTRQGERIVYQADSLSGPVQPGDTLAVRLTASGSNWRYMMIEDPIPAGTEFIQRDDLYEVKDKPSWWDFWFTRREFHDDRAAFFQTGFSAGQHDFYYLLKVVNPGKFRVSPAKIEPMYQPQYWATSDPVEVEVK